MTDLSTWSDSVRSGVSDAVHNVVVGIPDVLAALVVLLVGVIIGVVLKNVVVRLLKALKVGPLAKRVQLDRVFPGEYDFVGLVGDFVKWFFIVVFLLQAMSIVHLTEASNLVNQLLGYIPNVLVAAALIFVGAVVADLTGRFIMETARALGATTARFLSNAARYTVWAVVLFTALAQLGVNTLFLDRLFTAIVVMLALAGGLSFGLGGQGVAKDVLERMRAGLEREKL